MQMEGSIYAKCINEYHLMTVNKCEQFLDSLNTSTVIDHMNLNNFSSQKKNILKNLPSSCTSLESKILFFADIVIVNCFHQIPHQNKRRAISTLGDSTNYYHTVNRDFSEDINERDLAP